MGHGSSMEQSGQRIRQERISKYYIYQTGKGCGGITWEADQALPLIGDAATLEEAEKILRDFLERKTEEAREEFP